MGCHVSKSRQCCGRRDANLSSFCVGLLRQTAGKEQYVEILKIVLNYLDLEPLRMSHDDGEDVHQSIVESKA